MSAAAQRGGRWNALVPGLSAAVFAVALVSGIKSVGKMLEAAFERSERRSFEIQRGGLDAMRETLIATVDRLLGPVAEVKQVEQPDEDKLFRNRFTYGMPGPERDPLDDELPDPDDPSLSHLNGQRSGPVAYRPLVTAGHLDDTDPFDEDSGDPLGPDGVVP